MLTARESEILKKRERSGQMTGLPAAQPNHCLATAHAPAQVAVWPPGVPALALVGSRAWVRVIRLARCTESSLDADVWFPVSPGAQQARQEAAAAIAICKDCPVRSQCLALSPRYWDMASMAFGAAWSRPSVRACGARCSRIEPAPCGISRMRWAYRPCR